MYVTLAEIISNNLFTGKEVITGDNGLNKTVQRVSIYDCPYDINFLKDGVLNEGDLIISCLEQFRVDDSKVVQFFEALIKSKCSGLLMMTDDMRYVINDEVIKLCNEYHFPIVLIKDDLPYVQITNIVNQYIAVESMNLINSLKLDKIRYGNIDNYEALKTLNSIDTSIKKYLRVVFIKAELLSELSISSLVKNYLSKEGFIYIKQSHEEVFIISEESSERVKNETNALMEELKSYFTVTAVGYSRIYGKENIKNALNEAEKALQFAVAMKIKDNTYNPMSSIQLLLPIKDTTEAKDFYSSYVNILKKVISEDSYLEYQHTIRSYVANSGNYKNCALELGQHENTIRYRVNKVKSALGMENDWIKFHETIGIIVKLEALLGIEDK